MESFLIWLFKIICHICLLTDFLLLFLRGEGGEEGLSREIFFVVPAVDGDKKSLKEKKNGRSP